MLSPYFPYEERPEAAVVVSHFRNRQELRQGAKAPMDKRRNPLIAIPGSKGAGKSAFLVHLSDCKEFQETFDNPIVSTVTFNCAMTFARPVFGLRIIFGALRAMTDATMRFPTFVNELKQDDITAEEAVNLVWDMFGYRHLVICVDELSKSDKGSPKHALDIASDLGYLLDTYQAVHVVVSSLSTEYVASLTSGSQRNVVYIAPQPLFESDLASKSSLALAKQLQSSALQCEKPFAMTPFCVNLVKNTYLLASGHPLTLESLDRQFLQWMSGMPARWNDAILLAASYNALSLVYALAEMTQFIANLIGQDTVPASGEFELVLSSLDLYASDKSERAQQFRIALENNTAFVGRQAAAQITPAITLSRFLHGLRKLQSPGPLVKVAQTLFSALNDIADLLERAVDMTILSRSAAFLNLNDVFCCPKLPPAHIVPLTYQIDSENNVNQGTWVIPKARHPGVDSFGEVLDDSGTPHAIYVQVKCTRPRKPLPEIYASTIGFVMKQHEGKKTVPLIIFYQNFLHDPVQQV